MLVKNIFLKSVFIFLFGIILFSYPLSASTTIYAKENETIQEFPLNTTFVEENMEEYQINEIVINRGEDSIWGQVFIPSNGEEKHPLVIIGHGFGGSYRDNVYYAEFFASHGIAASVFDFVGGSTHSQSGGDTREMSVLTEVEDMKAVYNHFISMDFIDEKQIFLMGESQGGIVAALAGAELKDEIKGLILIYPAFVIPDEAKSRFNSISEINDETSLWGVSLGAKYYSDVWDLDVYSEISDFDGEVLIFHGDKDSIVDLSYSETAVEVYDSAELVVYAGAGHGFSSSIKKDASEKMLSFLEEFTQSASDFNPLEYSTIPREYFETIEDGGVIEKVNYSTEYNGEIFQKEALVYLPASYDRSGETKYNIFYLMHGGSGSASTFFFGEGRSSRLKNILDHMILNNDLEPMIVVTPSYYKSRQGNDGQLTNDFHEELVNDLMPVVESEYSTFAQTADVQGFNDSREHRAFGGFSMGSVTTWYTFIYNLEQFKYFMPMSADSWVIEMMGGASKPDETAAFLANVVKKSGFDLDDFFIFAITGTDDMAYGAETSQLEAMKKLDDTFVFCENLNECNLYYHEVENGAHTYDYMNEYIYNVLPIFFEK